MSRHALVPSLRDHAPVIAPSMLKCDFGNLHREVSLLEAAGARLLHLDVMDGHFVPNLSYGPLVVERLRPLTRLPLDAHLMVSRPADWIDGFLAAGCDAVTVHIESFTGESPAAVNEVLEAIRIGGAAVGLAISPATPITAVTEFIGQLDLLLVMSVEPGFGGQSFLPESIDRIEQLADACGTDGPLLAIDGGIGADTIGRAAAAGAELFVAGSAVFDSPDYRGSLETLRELAAGNSSNSSPSSSVSSSIEAR